MFSRLQLYLVIERDASCSISHTRIHLHLFHILKYAVCVLKLIFAFLETSKTTKKLWTAATMNEKLLDFIRYDEFMHHDSGVKSLMESLLQYGIGIVAPTPADELTTRQVVERVCFIQPTFFGDIWTFTANNARGDTAYTNIALGAHTDTTYLEIPAGIQVNIA